MQMYYDIKFRVSSPIRKSHVAWSRVAITPTRVLCINPIADHYTRCTKSTVAMQPL
jgi:hypothetical protein